MKNWDFTVILDVAEMTEALTDRLNEARCDDATIGSSGGVATACFSRESPSLQDAIASAVRDIRKAGCETSRVELEELAEQELATWPTA